MRYGQSSYSSPSRRSSPRRGAGSLLLYLFNRFPRLLALVLMIIASILWLLIPQRRSTAAGGLTSQQEKKKNHLQGSEWSYCGAALNGEEGTLAHEAGWKLLMLQVVIRHGDRSPIHSLTSVQPYYNCKFSDPEVMECVKRFDRYKIVGTEGKANMGYLGPKPDGKEECFPGQLTERGFKQQLANGRYLRLKYPTLTITSPEEVYFRSTHYPRTFQSGGALLLALAPQLETVAAHVNEINNQENLFGVGLHGASRKRLMNPAMSEERGHCQHAVDLAAEQELAFKPDKVLDAQVEALGGNMNLSVADQTDPLMASACSGKPLPCNTDADGEKCINRQTLKQMKEQVDLLYCRRYLGDEGGKASTVLSMQPFLKEVAARFTDSKIKLALYSAHDTVVAPILAALSAFDCRWPPYASRITFELWQQADQEEAMVRILYNGQVVSRRLSFCSSSSTSQEDDALVPLSCFTSYVQHLGGESPC